jgi:hypothetical protein
MVRLAEMNPVQKIQWYPVLVLVVSVYQTLVTECADRLNRFAWRSMDLRTGRMENGMLVL